MNKILAALLNTKRSNNIKHKAPNPKQKDIILKNFVKINFKKFFILYY